MFIEQFALISVEPTERGMTVIDEYHTYYVSQTRDGTALIDSRTDVRRTSSS